MKTQNAVVDDINKQLLVNGYNKFNNPNFRVVFSDDEIEKRWGTFDHYSESGIFLRSEHGCHELPKYLYIKSKWILERWAGPELTYHPDIESARDGDYVCVYIFQDVKGNYLPPLWKVTEIVVHALLHPRSKAQALEEDLKAELNADKAEEDRIFTRIKEYYEVTATEVETMSISKYVSPTKIKVDNLSSINANDLGTITSGKIIRSKL